MRVAFAGTPPFAACALEALIAAAASHRFELPLVLSQPDRPAGRGQRATASAVSTLAREHGLRVETPPTLNVKRGGEAALAAQALIRDCRPDVLVVAAYGLILPPAVLELPAGLPTRDGGRVRALNIHASLLPRWRGAAPVARAIEAGDTHTGTTIMQMDAGLDTGPMLLHETLAIGAEESTGQLTERLAAQGARLLLAALALGARGELVARPQPDTGVTYAAKLDKAEAWLDFGRTALELARQVRAFDPFPVACGVLGRAAQAPDAPGESPPSGAGPHRGADRTLRFWGAHALATGRPGVAPGTVLRADGEGILVACGDGVLALTELQRAGGRRLPAAALLAGLPIAPGDRFLSAGERAEEHAPAR